ncbi:hypothetical protein KSS87_018032 [Heliosperma pusillum]|nr:hypothetical protein KSS87_018032 [Heliosperma pusillum]
MVIENGVGNGSSSGSDGASLRTYKRRKHSSISASNFIDLDNIGPSPMPVLTSSDDKKNKDLVDAGLQRDSSEQVRDQKLSCHSLLNGSSDDCSYQQWKHILESICESLRPTEGGKGGIHNSVKEALKNPYASHAKIAKENVDDHLDSKLNFHRCTNGGVSTVTSNRSTNEFDHSTVSRLCECAFSKLLMSGPFASLCKLLSENFPGVKIDKLLDFNPIDIRMKDGTYERTPTRFSSDIQQLWGRLNSIGKEMVSLSNNLSELSRAFCHEMGGGSEPDTSSGRKPEAPARDCKFQIKQEIPDTSVFSICKQCKQSSDERDCLVCDSCEAMFHVSCIEPSIKEIPHKSWFCATCTSSGVGSPHEDCVVCDKLIANSRVHGGVNTSPVYDETLDEEEGSDGIIETGPQVFKGSKCLPCKSCGNNLNNGEEFFICEHRFCQFKYYHIRCLSSKELKSYGPHWYCPSCLCRVCLTDKDDDDIVMCDGCDHGYHIYCMNPPRSSIPRGKWFCQKCDVGIKAIRKVKKLYEDVERLKRDDGGQHPDGKIKNLNEDVERFKRDGGSQDPDGGSKIENLGSLAQSGGMDMLLTAARTLNGEDSFINEKDGKC